MSDLGLVYAVIVFLAAAALCYYVAWPHDEPLRPRDEEPYVIRSVRPRGKRS